MLQTRFGANVRAARQAARMTQEDLGARAGIHPVEVSRVETGQRDSRLSTVVNIAEALGVSIDQLVYGPPPPPSGGDDGTR